MKNTPHKYPFDWAELHKWKNKLSKPSPIEQARISVMQRVGMETGCSCHIYGSPLAEGMIGKYRGST